MTQIWWWLLMKIQPSSAVTFLLVCSQVYSISNINAKQLIWKNMINGLLFFFQLCVGLGKRVREALQHVLPASKQIYFEFQMHVPPEGDVPLQHGGMPASVLVQAVLMPRPWLWVPRVCFWLCMRHSPCAWMSHSTPLSLFFSVKRGLASLKNALKLMIKLPIDNHSKGDR